MVVIMLQFPKKFGSVLVKTPMNSNRTRCMSSFLLWHSKTTTSTISSRHYHVRLFSSKDSSKDSSLPPPQQQQQQLLCDVIQGPSLLRTPHARPNPSLLFLPGLRSLPFWTSSDYSKVAYGDPTVQHVVQLLEEHADAIREEYLQVAPTIPSDYHDDPSGGGGGGGDQQHASLHQGPTPWKWHSYLSKGHVQGQFVQSFPSTSRVLQQLRSEGILFEGTPFGFAFFSTLGPGSTIAPHTAPMNLRLRIHLSLIVPTITTTKSSDDDDTTTTTGTTTTTTTGDTTTAASTPPFTTSPPLGIRVGIHEREWVPSKALVLDDSYQHSVWNHHPSQSRVVLLVDIWHPDISGEERTAIVQLFQQARLDGLWKR